MFSWRSSTSHAKRNFEDIRSRNLTNTSMRYSSKNSINATNTINSVNSITIINTINSSTTTLLVK